MKTIEQISHEICDKYNLTIDLSIPIEDAIKEAQRWIPIEEELPEFSKIVFTIDDLGNYYSAYYDDSKAVFVSVETEMAYTNITHWRLIELK